MKSLTQLRWQSIRVMSDRGDFADVIERQIVGPFGEDKDGYLCLLVLVDGKAKLLYEHRLVAEQLVGGRPLTANEVVHHKDNNKKNNSVENLAVLSRSDHYSITRARMGKTVRAFVDNKVRNQQRRRHALSA